MMTGLIIFAAILVLSVVAHYFFWRDSKKRYSEYMKQIEALNEKFKQLEANDKEIDRMLDDADEKGRKMDDEIEALRSVWFLDKKKTGVES